MHLFDEADKLQKYANVYEIIENFYRVRAELYHKRKNYLVKTLEEKFSFLTNKARYIQETLDGNIDLRKKSKLQINELLFSKGFASETPSSLLSPFAKGNFDYLTKMPMDSVSEENVARIFKEKDAIQTELHFVQTQSIFDMWLNDLNKLEEIYIEDFKTKRMLEQQKQQEQELELEQNTSFSNSNMKKTKTLAKKRLFSENVEKAQVEKAQKVEKAQQPKSKNAKKIE